MKKKPAVVPFSEAKKVTPAAYRHWHNGGDLEISFYARSLHQTAQSILASLDLQPNPRTAWDACPVVLLYRQAVELHLKALVDEGGDFLKERTDAITLCKTHSLRWLAQMVSQIIKAVQWEAAFQCEGMSNLADFSALVSELEELDPVAVSLRSSNRRPDGGVPNQLEPPRIVQFAKKLDALIGVLDATTDALAATAILMEIDGTESGLSPTIQ
ncbi:MAG: hypothetical protein NTX13_19875 [Acidobacteria bacterium]|jgi:hypothetical protein|nr:hypothetical protein [Acidobacteriota bacterium]